MTADYITELLTGCDAVEGFGISADYSAKEPGAVCILPRGCDKAERGYCDGSSIMSSEFELIIRLAADRDKSPENRRLLERLTRELEAYGSAVPFPPLPEGSGLPLRIIITEKPVIAADDIHSARYKMSFKIRYLKEKQGQG